MIEVQRLTKTYGSVRAIDEVTFTVERGQVVGFLGPNGAGKTTTMRMLAGFLPPTDGTARIAGIDVVQNSLAARRKIGYLPENVPLYPEMTRQRLSRLRRRHQGRAGGARRAAAADRARSVRPRVGRAAR